MPNLITAIYKATIVNLILGFTFSFGAQFTWDLKVEESSYSLKLKMDYPKFVSLQQVRYDVKNLALLAQVSSPIQGGTIEGHLHSYIQSINLKSYGIPGSLISKCMESSSLKSWKRRCVLDTTMGAGKMSMAHKYDQVECFDRNGQEGVRGVFEIVGKAKNIVVLGVTLMEARALVLKGKYEAIKNFTKIWNFRVQGGVDLARTIQMYLDRKMQASIDKMFKSGNAKLKESNGKFEFSHYGKFNI
jgi:hypothetical protein